MGRFKTIPSLAATLALPYPRDFIERAHREMKSFQGNTYSCLVLRSVMDATKKNCPEWLLSFVVSAAEPGVAPYKQELTPSRRAAVVGATSMRSLLT